jgi:uncharacterized protein
MSKKYNVREAKQLKDLKNIKTVTCSVDWSTKSLTKDASGNIFIEGWANTVDKDRVGDVVLPSAFADTMKEYMDNPVLLFQHNWDNVVGNVAEFKIIDDENEQVNGLWIKAKISNAKDVEDVRTKIKEGILKTFSIGYNEVDADFDKETNTNLVTKVELLEISVVTIPANPFAKFSTVGEEAEKKTEMDDGIINFMVEAIKDLKDVNELSNDFLKEVIAIYRETNN